MSRRRGEKHRAATQPRLARAAGREIRCPDIDREQAVGGVTGDAASAVVVSGGGVDRRVVAGVAARGVEMNKLRDDVMKILVEVIRNGDDVKGRMIRSGRC